jgi:hypothetical protein
MNRISRVGSNPPTGTGEELRAITARTSVAQFTLMQIALANPDAEASFNHPSHYCPHDEILHHRFRQRELTIY